MNKTMTVRVVLSIEIDLEAMEANYSLTTPEEIREDVRYSTPERHQRSLPRGHQRGQDSQADGDAPMNDNNDSPKCPQYGCATNHPRGHDEVDGECVRCGEWTQDTDRGEAADGLVHASCLTDGEELA